MEQKDKIYHSIRQKYASSYVVQEEKADQWNSSENGKLGQCDTIENCLEMHV